MSNINLTCDVCGREVRGYTWVNGMKFCAKCYQETFSNPPTTQQLLEIIKNSRWDIGGPSNIVRLDKEAHNMELQKKVADLEEQLERKERIICAFEMTQKENEAFAIEKLQELKKSLRDKVCLMENDEHCYPQNAIHWQDVVAIIDNQIKQLKEENK